MSDVSARSTTAKFTTVQVQRIGRQREGAMHDLAAVEEPLEVRLHGRSFAVIMRTPGDDRALTAGFLLSEGVVTCADDVGAVEHCRHPDHPETHNVVDVYLHGPAAANLECLLRERRNVMTNSSCGLCGRVTIESLQQRLEPVTAGWRIGREIVAALPANLRERQVTFAETGGLHAAGLFQPDGTCDLTAEDVGRHNAVDKVVGAMLLDDRLPLTGHALVVSGRTSFEIVQKAWVAGVPFVCAVSAPSSLAIDLANEAGITLLGFVRDGGFNVYTHPGRIE
jgi:FdhD protein